jgi:hypothetical protein
VVGVFGKRFSETINLFQPHVIREVVHAAAAILDRPRSGFTRFCWHGETLPAWNGRHGDAEIDGTICRKLARFRA